MLLYIASVHRHQHQQQPAATTTNRIRFSSHITLSIFLFFLAIILHQNPRNGGNKNLAHAMWIIEFQKTFGGGGNPTSASSKTSTTNKMRYYKNYQPYSALVGQPLSLPCNITPPSADDDVSLILWYRDDLSTPIYTVDARGASGLATSKHFLDSTVLEDRVTFNITYPISYLRFDRVVEKDTAEYRCRVDFRRDRTINRVMRLNVIVPAKKLSIYDSKHNYISDIAGPFNEDSSLNLTCQADGGHPPPKLKWWKGDQMISDRTTWPQKGVAQNVIQFPRMLREHLMMPLTCESSNTNLTVPATQTILIDLNLKPTKVIIVRPSHNMTAGQRIELVCQSSGSRPPAKIFWHKNGKLMEHYSESTSDDGSVTTNIMAFVPTREDHGKWLGCTAYNPQFKDFKLDDKLMLDIHYAPILSLLLGANSKQQEIIEGSSVYFDCDIQANPKVQKFGWLFNDEPLATGNMEPEIDIRNNSIMIKRVNIEQSGQYQCYAVNPLGKGFSEIVNLNVKYAPICVDDQEIHYQIELFEQLQIECNVHADPKDLIFHWEFNSSSTIDDDIGGQPQQPQSQQKPMMIIDNGPESSRLRFTPKTSEDFGTLYCFAENRIGRQRKPCIYHISKSETPDAPQNCSLFNITVTSLTVVCGYSTTMTTPATVADDNNLSHANQPPPTTTVARQQYFILLIYDGHHRLIRNVTAKQWPRFHVTNLEPGDFDQLSLYVYAINNQNGHQSDRVPVPANNLVGQPRKLEHIEHKINIKPFLLLMFIGAFLVTSIGAFVLLAVFKLRRRYYQRQLNQNRRKRKPVTESRQNGGKKNRSVFDTAGTGSKKHETTTESASASEADPATIIMETRNEAIEEPSLSQTPTEENVLSSTSNAYLTTTPAHHHHHHHRHSPDPPDIFPNSTMISFSGNFLQTPNELTSADSSATLGTISVLNQDPEASGNSYLELTRMNQLIESQMFGPEPHEMEDSCPCSMVHNHHDHLHSHPHHHHHHHHHVKLCGQTNMTGQEVDNGHTENNHCHVSGELMYITETETRFPVGTAAGFQPSHHHHHHHLTGTVPVTTTTTTATTTPTTTPTNHQRNCHIPVAGCLVLSDPPTCMASTEVVINQAGATDGATTTFPCIIVAGNESNTTTGTTMTQFSPVKFVFATDTGDDHRQESSSSSSSATPSNTVTTTTKSAIKVRFVE